ncbi:Fis family transcriptional regulator [Thalassotalea litorea]|uniref:Fis family transcriptional regulator n=1 Tax=Thalassotalea litorea TaxID=2020715 RepID=UPI003734E203
MRKSDKKTDNIIRKVLTEACDIALEECSGFQWLTHTVNYDRFPGSLTVICVFATNEQITQVDVEEIRNLIKEKLAGAGINLEQVHKQVRFDSEQSCEQQHDGNWNKRLNH